MHECNHKHNCKNFKKTECDCNNYATIAGVEYVCKNFGTRLPAVSLKEVGMKFYELDGLCINTKRFFGYEGQVDCSGLRCGDKGCLVAMKATINKHRGY